MLEIVNLNRAPAFITKDGSEIRELLAHRNSSIRNQSLAEARLPVGGSTQEHYHPLAEEFLRFNSDLNDLPPIKFQHAAWAGANPRLGRFDLIIGSDLLYERGHPALLSAFLTCHTEAAAQVILADPGRKRCGEFSRKMAIEGYTQSEHRLDLTGDGSALPGGRMMSFVRGER